MSFSLIAIAGVIAFDLAMITAPDVIQAQYTPDDAYYYMVLARNFVNLHAWTFDSGRSVTTGFHPLQAYLLSGIYAVLRPSREHFVHWALALGSLLTVVSLVMAWIIGLKLKNTYHMMALALIASSRNFLQNSVSVMEWPLVLLFAISYVAMLRFSGPRHRARDALLLLTIGLGGSLARSDFGLLPLALFAASLLHWMIGGRKSNAMHHSFAGLLGASLGLLLLFVHHFVFAGDFMQSSVRIKSYWAQALGIDHWNSIYLIPQALGMEFLTPDRAAKAMLAGFVALVCLLGFKQHRRRLHLPAISVTPPRDFAVIAGCALSIMGYVWIYSSSGGVQPWYTATLVVPVFVWITAAGSVAEHMVGRRVTLVITSSVVLVTMVRSAVLAAPIGESHAPWPHQQVMLEAGNYLRDKKLKGDIGAWNAGIIGYYQGGTIMNLDGLVNNDVIDYVVRNSLPLYLDRKGIRYVVDFENMFTDESVRTSRGYDDEAFLRRLAPMETFGRGKPFGWRSLTLYEVAAPGDST